MYYLFVFVYISTILWLNHDVIESTNIIQIASINSIFSNYSIILFVLIALAIIWDYLFISCKTLANFKFKDIELTINELDQVKYIDNFREKQISSLDAVLNAKLDMIKFVDNYVENNELDPDESYKDILKEYENKRGNIKIHVYFENEITSIETELGLKSDQLSAILYSLQMFGFCNPKEFNNGNYIFAWLKTKYSENDIIVVLISDSLVDKENLMLFDVINYFEVLVSVNILEAEKESDRVSIS